MLTPRQKSCPLLNESFQRFGGKELQEHVPALSVSNRESILAEAGKPNLVKMHVAPGSERFNRGLLGELRLNGFNLLPGAQREAREKIIWHGHARDDVHVDQPLVHEQ